MSQMEDSLPPANLSIITASKFGSMKLATYNRFYQVAFKVQIYSFLFNPMDQ